LLGDGNQADVRRYLLANLVNALSNGHGGDSYQLPVISYQLSVISHQLSVISYLILDERIHSAPLLPCSQSPITNPQSPVTERCADRYHKALYILETIRYDVVSADEFLPKDENPSD
jgi:hypothetical protein